VSRSRRRTPPIAVLLLISVLASGFLGQARAAANGVASSVHPAGLAYSVRQVRSFHRSGKQRLGSVLIR
jgi:hypothetical protein